jgi:endonuclease/exonuclease/phosphatase family metal-dependent hydrolase
LQTNQSLTFATANLFNFLQPPNAFYDFENIYDSKAWQEKCAWTQARVQELNADIIGLQEVFSIEAAQTLFKQSGYPYFVTIDQPEVEQDYIYSKPVVALASKYPIKESKPVTISTIVETQYHTSPPPFSRKPLFAIVEVENIGEVAVCVCHLKSQRAVEPMDSEQSQESVGRWLSGVQRGWESIMLKLYMHECYELHPMPSIVMGDFNQPLSSDITHHIVTNPDQDPRSLILKDSWEIYATDDTDKPRSPTHYHFSKGNVLDYILLSQEFQPDSDYSMADIVEYKVIDQHLINPMFYRDKQASDHAFVAVTAQFIL